MEIPAWHCRCLNTNQQHKTNGFAALEGGPERRYPYIYRVEDVYSPAEMSDGAAYRQVFSEHETLKFNRQITLETRLANGSITVRDFMRELAKSERFYRWLFRLITTTGRHLPEAFARSFCLQQR